MNYFEQLNVSAGHYGKNGQAIITEVWSKLRCIASNIMNAITGQTFQMNQIINLKEVMQITGLSRATIYNILDERHKHYDPTFPKQANFTVSRVGWSAWEIHQWIEFKLASR